MNGAVAVRRTEVETQGLPRTETMARLAQAQSVIQHGTPEDLINALIYVDAIAEIAQDGDVVMRIIDLQLEWNQ